MDFVPIISLGMLQLYYYFCLYLNDYGILVCFLSHASRQGRGNCLLTSTSYCLTLKIEAVRFSEVFLKFYQTTHLNRILFILCVYFSKK
jgi:hypothetical protein